MFVSLKANKKRIIAFALLAAAVVAACLFLRWQKQGEPQKPQEIVGETNEERLAFLASFGWQVEGEPAETREVMIPREFNDVYQNYNAMQQAQGFDLAPYSGEVVTQYKYLITNYQGETEVYATLLVYGRLIIGGDVACGKVDGFMHGFAKDSARYGEATPAPQPTAGPDSQPESESSYVTPEAVESGAPESASADDANPPQESQSESGVQSEQASDDTAATPEEAWPTD
ncbi:DUF4830 domain-containing protein [Acutalibacter muris]|uniref:DUF4830 domain-containing protein n=1 Tax=Acutalibacter muris TaxID=1796620 RepID=A0A1Z2XPP8_9FIRM|nr:DUF4830 domain-containing protein [Acutalibacter muris]ANU52936.1 hypothetical protein A4V00_02265 [Hungateiclostridiaceae bacterium KB18]ASB40389.1 hypothetical protein ADH66_06745 [Acutalibacter muris]MCI9192368.1 DUF4830 domain-containing protein [Acutalibacter muris]QQR29681.1 DUF4830 domain-containing protein [Acutalibacter muris]